MKISFLLPGRNFSGGVRCGTRMASELLHRGHDVQILYRSVLYGNDVAHLKSIAKGLYNQFLVKSPKDWVSQFRGKRVPFRTLRAGLVGKRDVLVSTGPDCVDEMMKLPDECGRKVFYAHGLTLRNPEMRKKVWGENIPTIAVSNCVRQEIELSGHKSVFGVVPNGVDSSDYFPEEPESERLAVGTIFGPGIAKDPETILSVFTMLREKRPDLRFICFGSCPRPSGLETSIEYKRLPTVTEARKLYCKCAVWFCASRSEGFGLPLLEAMSCGCAVVSSDCGGPNDFIKTGINGVIVKKESPHRLAEEIVKIVDDKSLRMQLASEALETSKQLSWSSAAAKLEKVLEDITHHS